jgi:hypothetical protein
VGLRCTRHLNPTRITCVTCDTPICPECAIRTPVGFKCPDHATKPPAPTRSRLGAWMIPVVILAVVGLAQVLRTTGRGDPARPRCPTETAPDVGIGPAGGGTHWREMSPTDLCGRYDASVAWTGDELLIWGGESCAGAACPTDLSPRLADGAAYNVANDAWRKLAPSPLSAREAGATVWTGAELLIWGGTSGQGLLSDGAAYNPAEDSWRRVARSPLDARTGSAAVWTGREMVIWGGSEKADGAAYDPAADRWRRIADAPVRGRYSPATVWTGRELLVWGGDSERAFFADDGAAYDPAADRWRMLPRAPVSARTAPAMAWSGREMLMWGGIGPPGAGDNSPLDRIIERRTLLTPVDDGAAYDPATDRWRTLEPVPLLGRGFPISAWDGQGMIIWGGLVVVSSPASASEGVRYTP